MVTKGSVWVRAVDVAFGRHWGTPHGLGRILVLGALLRERIASLPRLRAIVVDEAYRALERLARRKGLGLDIKAKPPSRRSSRCGL